MKLYYYIVLVLSLGLAAIPGQARVTNGELNLKESFFQSDETIDLDGNWKFYWQNFIDPLEPAEIDGPPKLVDFMTSWSDLPQFRGGCHAKGFATYEIEIFSSRESEKVARNGQVGPSISDS